MDELHRYIYVNASINILKRATLGQRESYAQGDYVRPQNGAVVKELRTDKTHPLMEVIFPYKGSLHLKV